jgi:hypothetical protein
MRAAALLVSAAVVLAAGTAYDSYGTLAPCRMLSQEIEATWRTGQELGVAENVVRELHSIQRDVDRGRLSRSECIGTLVDLKTTGGL